MISGIYKIVNKINNKYYIGSSKNIIQSRWKHHKTILKNNKHFNHHLQSSWNKYGKDNFEFIIVEEVLINNLLIIEQKYLDVAKMELDKCYNTNFTSGCGPGIKKGAKFSNEHKKNLSKSHIGQNAWNKNKTKKLNKSLKKMSKSKTGKSNFKIAKNYVFLNPNKEIININNLSKFCKENKLDNSTMSQLFNGKGGYKSHKGWTKYV